MNFCKYTCIVLFIGFFIVSINGVNAQDTLKRRPRIGLVLSGGGAKGLTHIGVLKVLEELNIPVDYIAGTSMGSIVGGLYACGYDAKQIEAIFKGMNWNDIMLDRISRKSISIEEKDEDGKYVAELPIKKWKVQLPMGLVAGQKVSAMLSHLTAPVHTISNFDQLPIPFRCVATDIEKVQPYVLKEGFLPDAIRASMAIPSVFNPIEIDGRLLVDGGICRNFPVQDARDMGADIVIGVNVSDTLYSREQLNTAMIIMDQVTISYADKSNKAQGNMCDYLIQPNIRNYNMFSFDAVDSLIRIGENAARAIYPQLKALSAMLASYHEPIKKMNRPVGSDSLYVSTMRVEGLEKVSDKLVASALHVSDSSWISYNELERGIERVYGTRFFQRVNYKIIPSGKASELVVRVKEQTADFFKFGLNYDNNQKASIMLSVTFRNQLGEGSRLVADVKLGEYPAFVAKYTIQTSVKPNIGMGLKLGYYSSDARFYNSKGKLLMMYDLNDVRAEIDFRSAISNYFMYMSGLQWEYINIKPQIETLDTTRISTNFMGFFLRLRFDTYDRAVFAHKGDQFFAETKYIFNEKQPTAYNWDRNLWQAHFIYNKVIPVSKKLCLETGLYGGTLTGKSTHYAHLFYLGGWHPFQTNIFPFSGLRYMGISGRNLMAVGLNVRLEPWSEKFITLKTNIANKSEYLENFIKLDDLYYGVGISGGVNTIIGPVELTLSRGNVSKDLIGEIRVGFFF